MNRGVMAGEIVYVATHHRKGKLIWMGAEGDEEDARTSLMSHLICDDDEHPRVSSFLYLGDYSGDEVAIYTALLGGPERTLLAGTADIHAFVDETTERIIVDGPEFSDPQPTDPAFKLLLEGYTRLGAYVRARIGPRRGPSGEPSDVLPNT